ESAIVGQMTFPKAGTYQFLMHHDDGAIIAFDPSKCSVVGTKLPYQYYDGSGNHGDQGTTSPGVYRCQNIVFSSRSVIKGFPFMAGNNNSTNTTSKMVDYFQIKVNTDNSVIDFEIDWTNWEHKGHMVLTCQDPYTGLFHDIVPSSTALKTQSSTPSWPAWSTS